MSHTRTTHMQEKVRSETFITKSLFKINLGLFVHKKLRCMKMISIWVTVKKYSQSSYQRDKTHYYQIELGW